MRSTAIAGEQGRDKLGISHPSLPRKGGRGQEVQGAGRGSQLHESLQQPAADGQDTRRKRRFPWIRCREEVGTSPWAQVVLSAAGWGAGHTYKCQSQLEKVADLCLAPWVLMCCTGGGGFPCAVGQLLQQTSSTGLGLVPSSEAVWLPMVEGIHRGWSAFCQR